jgi:hypothetical protein
MAPKGEIVITLSSDEVKALQGGLQELTKKPGSANLEALQSIQHKLRVAEEKML